jgi:hypothetical protein
MASSSRPTCLRQGFFAVEMVRLRYPDPTWSDPVDPGPVELGVLQGHRGSDLAHVRVREPKARFDLEDEIEQACRLLGADSVEISLARYRLLGVSTGEIPQVVTEGTGLRGAGPLHKSAGPRRAPTPRSRDPRKPRRAGARARPRATRRTVSQLDDADSSSGPSGGGAAVGLGAVIRQSMEALAGIAHQPAVEVLLSIP